MNTYTVKFYYLDDLRCDRVVEGIDESSAIKTALRSVGGRWANEPGFRIEIEMYAVRANRPDLAPIRVKVAAGRRGGK